MLGHSSLEISQESHHNQLTLVMAYKTLQGIHQRKYPVSAEAVQFKNTFSLLIMCSEAMKWNKFAIQPYAKHTVMQNVAF